MTDPTIFGEAQQVIGRRWSKKQSKEQERIFILARDAMVFISETGQQYPFLDFREGRPPCVSSSAGEEEAGALWSQLCETERFFELLLEDPAAADEQAPIQTILDALRFICSTRQLKSFGDYLHRVESNAPPLVVASFETREQAEAWLKNHPNPPYCAGVLVGNKHHLVVYNRETNFRRLPWTRDMERYLGWLERDDPPVAQATFDTLEQAEAWFRSQAHPPLRTWVRVGGEFYLAVYHPNVNHRALYPLSMAIRPPEEDGEDVTDEPR